MDLRDFINRNKGEEFLWSLVLEPDWVQAGIWTIVDGEAKVISISNPVAWDKKEDLITSADTALSSAVQKLPENAKEPNKVVFGVPASWVKSGSIAEEHLEYLKVLCSKLTLTPAGFVTLPEAVSFYIKSQEGSPLTAVTLSLGKELVEVSVFRLGNLLGSTQVARSVSLFDDVVEGLSRFNLQDPAPSRFIIFDGKDGELDEAKQALLSGSWESLTKVKLLHTPKIEILTADRKVEAVSLGGASEIAQVSKVMLINGETKAVESALPKINGGEEAAEVADVAAPDDMGFVVDQDVANVSEVSEGTEIAPALQSSVKKSLPPFLSKLVNRAKNISAEGKKPLLMSILAFLLVTVGLFAFWWFYPKATVTIFVSPQKLDEKTSVLVKPGSDSTDLENKTLPGKEVTKEVSGDKTTSTTGSKLVGEKAVGEVEIRNVSGDELDLKKGDVITSGSGLEYKLQNDVSVPANASTVDPGKESVKVEAADIGPEYNLPKDELFKVGTFTKSAVDAVATADFSGGASRQIEAIGEEDRKRVLDELISELSDKAKGLLAQDTSEDELFIDGSSRVEVKSTEYSGKVGDEASSLKLTLTVNVVGVVVSKNDLFEFAKNSLNEKVPQGYLLRETQVDYSFELKEYDKDKNTYLLEGNMSANLLPEVDTDSVANDIVGKYPEVAQEYLGKIPGFVRAQISISPRFPGKLGSLPRVVGNITVDLAAEK